MCLNLLRVPEMLLPAYLSMLLITNKPLTQKEQPALVSPLNSNPITFHLLAELDRKTELDMLPDQEQSVCRKVGILYCISVSCRQVTTVDGGRVCCSAGVYLSLFIACRVPSRTMNTRPQGRA